MGNVTQLESPTEKCDLRTAFQIELEQSGLSAARAADQIGRHASSITRWLNGTYTGDNEAVAADVERWLDTRADAAKRSLDGAGLDRHAETTASRQITSALAYAHAAGDIVAIIGRPGRGKTWASERYCAGRTNAFYLAVSSAVFSLPGLLSLVGEAIGAGRHHRSALEGDLLQRPVAAKRLQRHLRLQLPRKSPSFAPHLHSSVRRWNTPLNDLFDIPGPPHWPAANRWTGVSGSRSTFRRSP